MSNGLNDLRFYQMSMEIWDCCWKDTELMMNDIRGREIVKQLIRSVGSVSANIEEGYGRGKGKEYPHFLRIARGSANESAGWYIKSKFLLNQEVVKERTEKLNAISAMITKTIETLNKKKGKGTETGT